MGRGESDGSAFSRERDWEATRPDGSPLAEDSAEITVLDAGPIDYNDLPVAGDYDLSRQIDARWGCDPASLGWRLIEIPITALSQFAPAAGLAYYQHLAELDLASADDEEWDEEEDELFEGQARYEVAKRYKERYLAGETVEPIVIAWDPDVQLLDGFHRLAAAFEAGVERVRAYALLEED